MTYPSNTTLLTRAHVEIEIPVAVKSQHLLHHCYRHALGRWPSSAPVKQPPKPKLVIALPPAPHLPVADADDLGCLPPGDFLRHCSQNYFLYLHCSLHCGLRVKEHAFHALLPPPPAADTSLVNSAGHILCYRHRSQ